MILFLSKGAVCVRNELKISTSIVTDLHIARLRWLVKSASQTNPKLAARSIYLPVYLNATRYSCFRHFWLWFSLGQMIPYFNEFVYDRNKMNLSVDRQKYCNFALLRSSKLNKSFLSRSDVLFTANFALAEGQQETVFYEKGVALIASATLS